MINGSIFDDLNISYREGNPTSHSESSQSLNLGNPGWTLSTGRARADSTASTTTSTTTNATAGVPWYVWAAGALLLALVLVKPRSFRR